MDKDIRELITMSFAEEHGMTEDWHYWKTKIKNLWWFTLGYRIRNWRSKKC